MASLSDLRTAVAEMKDAAEKAIERVTAREQGLAQRITDLEAENARLKGEIPEPELINNLTQNLNQAADLLRRL